MILAARYHSYCRVCARSIEPGDSVEWERGERAAHASCVAPRAKPVAPPVLTVVPDQTEPTETDEAETIATMACGTRPYPHVSRIAASDLATWDPVKTPVYYTSVSGAQMIRAGEQYAILRHGHRFPLGHSSDRRRVVSHNATRAAILAACPQVNADDHAYVSGHGYHTAQSFRIAHMSNAYAASYTVTHRLLVTNDHTGAGALRASIVCYVDDHAVGAVATARGLHTSSNPERWQSDVDGMIETAILAQDDLLALLAWAHAHRLTDDDRRWLRKRSTVVRDSARTALDAMRAWHGATSGRARSSWGVWSRRLDTTGLTTLRALRATHEVQS